MADLRLHRQADDPFGHKTVEAAFDRLEDKINQKFNQLQAETAKRFRWLARSTGQRLRVRYGRG